MVMSTCYNDFNIMFGDEQSNTTCENVCIDCCECILNEYDLNEVVTGYDDKGNNIIVACQYKNYLDK